jgi:hypothetical protein
VKDFLKKTGLLQTFSIEIEAQKNDFISAFKKKVDDEDIGLFSDTFDVFSSSKNTYKGSIDSNSFKIKRRKKFFEARNSMALATGTFRQKGENVVIDTEVNGFSKWMIPFYVTIILFYFVFIFIFVFGIAAQDMPFMIIPFIFIHGLLMFFIPYFVMKKSVTNMRHDLEREFYFMTRKQPNT